ncbi:MAG: rRNA maturation RNase YbeY [Bacteroidota bacterium]|nr:rRNA maturation RNase YbeY [Bacteroidota bacterium]
MEPKIYYKDVKFRLGRTKEIKNWIVQVIRSEKKVPGDLSFIFVGDSYIKEINEEFLNHDYRTDVIAFDNGQKNIISGEIYLGIDTIVRNAGIYDTGIKNEVMRVMVHAVLHLIGYDDRDEVRKDEMREKEDLYLDKFGK